MIIRNISVRAKLILTTLVIVLLLTFLTLIYLDATRRVSRQAELIKARSELSSKVLTLQNNFHLLLSEKASNQLASFQSQVLSLEEELRGVLTHENTSGNDKVLRKSEQLSTQLVSFVETLRFTGQDDSIRWIQAQNDMALVGGLFGEWDDLLSQIQEETIRSSNRLLGISMALGIFLLANYMILLTMNIGRSFRLLSRFTLDMSKGIIPPPLDITAESEFGQLAKNLNQHAADLQNKVALLSSMSEEGPGEIFTPAIEDELGNALLVLSDYLTRKELDEVTRNREDKRRNWISEGMAQLGEVLRSEREDVGELSFLIVQKLVLYMNLEMGSLFISDDSDPENPVLRLATSYAFDRRKKPPTKPT